MRDNLVMLAAHEHHLVALSIVVSILAEYTAIALA